ncbi:MAG: ABC1 kinase family protein [Acidimicrobiales bacterium]
MLNPPGIVVSLVVAVAVAWAARRLLDARKVSPVRTGAAALLGVTAAWSISLLLERRGVEPSSAVLASAVLAVLLTMAIVVAFDLAARPRSGRSAPGRPLSLAGLGDRVNDARRLREVLVIARRNGLGAVLGTGWRRESDLSETEIGERLRGALEEAGGVYVKLGQLLSTRPDVLPQAIREQLSFLQADVSPAGRAEMEAELRRHLGVAPDTVFAEFDWEPLGSASIGQAYRARLVDGRPVVVKIRRPGIVETIERDLGTVVRLARAVERRTSWGELYRSGALAEQFSDDLRQELDYDRELRNASEVRSSYAQDARIHVPIMYEEYSSGGVLTMEMVAGVSVGELDRTHVEADDGPALAGHLFQHQLTAMLTGDTFHADPHPGNVLLMDDGRLSLIDFGSCSRLDAIERSALTDILVAIELRDPNMLSETVILATEVGPDIDPTQLERALAALMSEHLGPGKEPSVELMMDLLSIVRRFRIVMPPNILAVFRALGTMEGTLQQLDPDFALIDSAREVVGTDFRQELTPSNLSEALRDEVIALAPMLRRAPRHLDRIAGQLVRGELTARVSIFSHRRDVEVINALLNRLILGMLGAALGLVSVLLFRTDGGPQLATDLSLFQLLGFIGLIGGAILVMRVVLEITQSNTR